MPIKTTLKSLTFLLFLLSSISIYAQQEAIIRNFLHENKTQLELKDSDIQDWVIYDNYSSAHNGVSHIYIRQRINGIEIYNAIANFNIKSF